MLQNLNAGTESDRKAHPDQDRDKERVMKNWNITEMAVWMVLEAQNAERLDKTRGFYAQGNHRDHGGALE